MNLYKILFSLIVLMSTSIGISAQTSFVLWGYCDNPQYAVSFTFVLDKGNNPFGIILSEGFSIESFRSESGNPLNFISENKTGISIKVFPEDLCAVIKYPNSTKRQFKLQKPPLALMQSLQNSSSSTTSGYNSCRPESKTCTLCHGKGWIQGNSTPKYGNTGEKYCSDCGGYFSYSHSHDRCPSCQGRGYTNY